MASNAPHNSSNLGSADAQMSGSRDDWHVGNVGLDQADLDTFSEEEREAFFRSYAATHGTDPKTGRYTPYGPYFFADHGQPGHMKRYRLLVTSLLNADPAGDTSYYPTMIGELVWYCRGGFREGVRYAVMQNNQYGDRTGLTKAECVEAMGLAFWWIGSRGMREIQEALEGYEWTEPELPVSWAPGWRPDPESFRSGLDFSTPELNSDELASLEQWYEQYLGEVPPHIRLLAKYRPVALKAWRNRFENTLRLLPKQLAPYAMIHVNTMVGCAAGIREGIQLAKGFGMTRDQVLWAAGAAPIWGGVEVLGLVEAVAGDVLDGWEE